ncbi:Hypothetical protein MAGb_3520 [Mycoplasmopsis agalactiae 14628]|uniref:Aminoacyl-tRNA synthetase class II (D/K/N) domain-containing protein n=1 Tax=Mycoplasmopsis agalactiae 14628 TaxID=1110504 RepID=I5D6C6_MYCAA|nr:amino acid--tRNA ligase-related protein [Mycoplasmopsis agalactiae]EIN15235.1 Hypothetical protein MAGb_3520 [Mycoplasmopsis agalactiae 14628]
MYKFSDSILQSINCPSIIAPFYQKNYKGIAQNSDSPICIGETVGAGEWHKTYNKTVESINRHNNIDDYKLYLDIKSQNLLKTAGFGINLEELILFLINESEIRNAQLIARKTDKEILT